MGGLGQSHMLNIQARGYLGSSGMTLLELIVVVAIVGILTAIGVPVYNGFIDDARAKEAQNNLRSIRLVQESYKSDNNSYYGAVACSANSFSTLNTNLFDGKSELKGDNWQYCITSASSTAFTARAEEVGSGNDWYQIDQNNATNSSIEGVNCNSGSCW